MNDFLPEKPRAIVIRGLVAAWCLTIGGVAYSAPGEASPRERMLEMWKRRQASITSFYYECETTHIVPMSPVPNQPKPFDPSSDDDAEKVADLKGTFRFACFGKKLALLEIGEEWNPVKQKPRKRHAAYVFDGGEDRDFLETEGMPLALGHLTTNAAEPDGFLTQGTLTLPFWLAVDPAPVLQRIQGGSSNCEIDRVPVSYKGRPCLRLRMPRPAGSNWEDVLLVDPARGYVPVRLTMSYNGVVRSDREIEYVANDACGWRVSAWNSTRFQEDGLPSEKWRVKVTRCSINEPLDDALFELEYPKGAHIVEEDGGMKAYIESLRRTPEGLEQLKTIDDGRRYFIAQGGDARRYIPEEEYGRPPSQ